MKNCKKFAKIIFKNSEKSPKIIFNSIPDFSNESPNYDDFLKKIDTQRQISKKMAESQFIENRNILTFHSFCVPAQSSSLCLVLHKSRRQSRRRKKKKKRSKVSAFFPPEGLIVLLLSNKNSVKGPPSMGPAVMNECARERTSKAGPVLLLHKHNNFFQPNHFDC